MFAQSCVKYLGYYVLQWCFLYLSQVPESAAELVYLAFRLLYLVFDFFCFSIQNIIYCNGRKYLFQAKHLNWRTRPGNHIRNPDYHLARSHFTKIFYHFEIFTSLAFSTNIFHPAYILPKIFYHFEIILLNIKIVIIINRLPTRSHFL